MHAFAHSAAVAASAADNDVLTWWLASACTLAFLLTTTAAILVSVHQRRERVPESHYRRHSPTGGPSPHE